ncbi:uncharacterized protein LOC100903961 [Galendromus occidentalis]|uniref:Uncharacterized protein LOC100903961 n=1 Tax=Galendromus occidentalis TaxID=34638 RepID=A0AAJ6QM01_9ACAR|nr:uncharacterized protein LOC100903961 [Galendromus occidentalis]
MGVETPRIDVSKELQRARDLVATLGFKPFLPQIPLEVRLSLAETFSSEESIDRLTAAKRLHRSIATEYPLWEEYTDLAEWLDQMDAEEREAEEVQRKYQEDCEIQLQEALRGFEEFMSKNGVRSGHLDQTRISGRMETKDDLQVGTSSDGGSELRRRPSFVADTSQSNIEVGAIGGTCSKKPILPVTSTPHVPQRAGRPRVSDVEPEDLFCAQAGSTSYRSRAPSLTHADFVRSKTFELRDENAAASNILWSSFDAQEKEAVGSANRTQSKEPDVTVVKNPSVQMDVQHTEQSGNIPRIASGRSRPVLATRGARESHLQKPVKVPAKIQVLPSKTSSGLPARQLPSRRPVLPSKDPSSLPSKPTVAQPSRTTAGIARPSKPGRLPVRK